MDFNVTIPRTPRPSDLPRAMTALPNWVAWRTETRGPSDKPTKVPYCLTTGEKAKSTDPADWTSYPSSLPDHYDGVGFVLSKDAGIVGIDLDDCLASPTEFKPWALPIIEQFRDTYCEVSPSGTGVKIFAGGTLPSEKGMKIYIGADGKPTKTRVSDEAIEIYSWGRYFAVTGKSIARQEVGTVQFAIDSLQKMMARVRGERTEQPTLASGEMLAAGSRHNYLLVCAGKVRNQGLDRDALIIYVRQLNQRVCNPPKPEREIQGIVDFVMAKPPQYKLTPTDFKNEAAQTATGDTVDQPQPVRPVMTDDIVAYAENLLVAAIESKDPKQVLGDGAEPSELIRALAQAGEIKRFEARRRIKEAFKNAIPLSEFDARIKSVDAAMRVQREEGPKSPYLMSAEGALMANAANAITMLSELPVKFNSFTQQTFLTAPAPWGSLGPWKDYDDVKAAEWCQRQNLNIPHHLVAPAIEAVARSREHYHPVREYLDSLSWDGNPRIDAWLRDYLGVEEDGYTSHAGRKWLIAAVQRVFEPGCQADYTLVLEGEQGKKKSTALRILCGDEWFTDDITDVHLKDSAIQLQGQWIVELSELDAFRGAEMTTIKAWLTRRYDNFRPPYGRRAEKFPRQNVFAATTNKEKWLKDETGGRRFWPVNVGTIDLDGLRMVRGQLWAEAYTAYLKNEPAYMTDAGEWMASGEQKKRREPDPWKGAVLDWAAAPHAFETIHSTKERVYVPEILQHGLGLDKARWEQKQSNRVAAILRESGYCAGRDPKKKGGKEYFTRDPER